MEAKNLKVNQILFEDPKENSTRKNKFISVPVKKDSPSGNVPLDLRIRARMKIFAHEESFSLGISLDSLTNLENFQKLEEILQALALEAKHLTKKISPRLPFNKEEFRIIKQDKFEIQKLYAKLYTGKNKKITARFSIVLSEENKSKALDPHEVIGVPLDATAVVRIQRLFLGNIRSVTLAIQEVLIHEVIQPASFFDEYDNPRKKRTEN